MCVCVYAWRSTTTEATALNNKHLEESQSTYPAIFFGYIVTKPDIFTLSPLKNRPILGSRIDNHKLHPLPISHLPCPLAQRTTIKRDRNRIPLHYKKPIVFAEVVNAYPRRTDTICFTGFPCHHLIAPLCLLTYNLTWLGSSRWLVCTAHYVLQQVCLVAFSPYNHGSMPVFVCRLVK